MNLSIAFLISSQLLLIKIPCVNSQILFTNIVRALEQVKTGIDSKLFLYQDASSQWRQSTVYRFNDFLESLKVMTTDGVAGKKFYIGEDVTNGHVYGLVNIAAFLAQSMKETIRYVSLLPNFTFYIVFDCLATLLSNLILHRCVSSTEL